MWTVECGVELGAARESRDGVHGQMEIDGNRHICGQPNTCASAALLAPASFSVSADAERRVHAQYEHPNEQPAVFEH